MHTNFMRAIWIILLLAAVPAAHAHGLYVSEHNLTYTLEASDSLVAEKIVFENAGDPFTFQGRVYFNRGDARDIVVNRRNYDVSDGEQVRIGVDMQVSKGQKIVIEMSYRRSDMLYEQGAIKVFEGLALGTYDWPVQIANIRVIAPKDNQFGSASPRPVRRVEQGREVLVYGVSTIGSLSDIQAGFPVKIEYGNFKELAIEKIASGKTLISEAEYRIMEANMSIENARYYNVDLLPSTAAYNQSLQWLQKAREQLQFANANYDAPYRNYYAAFKNAEASESYARTSIKASSDSKSQANFEVQRFLERKISDINSALASQQDLTRALLEAKTPWGKILLYLALVAALIFAAVFAEKKWRAAKAEAAKTEDFRNIEDLKKRRFSGFEEKISRVKKSGEVASEIAELRAEGRRLEEEMAGLRRKMVAGEVQEADFRLRKDELDRRVYEVDLKISEKEKELKDVRAVRDSEAGKTDVN